MANTEDDKDSEGGTAQPDPQTRDETAKADIEDAQIVTDEGPEQDADECADSEEPQAPAKNDEDEMFAELERGSDPAEAKPTPAPTPSARGGIIPPVIGGVVAAAIGFGVAQYMGSAGLSFGGGNSDETAMLLAGNSERLETTQDQLAAIDARLAEMAAQNPAGDIAAQITALEDQVSALAGQVAGFDQRLTDAIKAPVEAAGGATAKALAAYEEEVAAMREENARLADTVASVSNEAEAEVSAAMDRAAEVEARAALMRIDAALASGAPFDGVMNQFDGIEVPAGLSDAAASGVPTMAELQRDFPTAARAALDVALEEEADGAVGDRLNAFLRAQLGVRSLAPREGDDPDAVLSRAEAALREGDLRGTIAELDALPEGARGAMSDWIGSATMRADAVEAARALEQSLNTN